MANTGETGAQHSKSSQISLIRGRQAGNQSRSIPISAPGSDIEEAMEREGRPGVPLPACLAAGAEFRSAGTGEEERERASVVSSVSRQSALRLAWVGGASGPKGVCHKRGQSHRCGLTSLWEKKKGR